MEGLISHKNVKRGDAHKRAVSGEVVSRTQVAARHFQISLLCPHIARNTAPGQFIQVRVSDSHDPLLSRPFAVYRAREDIFDILFRVVGRGTRLLAGRHAGDRIRVVGPLGNGFPVDGDFQRAILVAGGMGIAALMSLAETMANRQITALIGASTQDGIIGEKDLLELGAGVHIATDDGTAGHKGMVPELLEELLASKESPKSRIFACGPMPMLKAVAQIAAQYGIPAYVSLEERMACGVGACLGCACQVVSPEGDVRYKTVCADGPVFNAQEIVWK